MSFLSSLCGVYKKRILICDGCHLETSRWYVKDNKKYCRKCVIEKVNMDMCRVESVTREVVYNYIDKGRSPP